MAMSYELALYIIAHTIFFNPLNFNKMKKCDVAECQINYVNPVAPYDRVKITSSKATYDLI